MLPAIGDLVTLGYLVTLVCEELDGRPAVYRVDGFGASLYVEADDAPALASLADPVAHEERVAQSEGRAVEIEVLPSPPSPVTVVAERVVEALDALAPNPSGAAVRDAIRGAMVDVGGLA
jgi:hypothetical protein